MIVVHCVVFYARCCLHVGSEIGSGKKSAPHGARSPDVVGKKSKKQKT